MRSIYRQSARSSGDGGQTGIINRISGQRNGLCSLLLIGMSFLTTGTYADPSAPLVKQVEAYSSHTCALFRTGEVSCWGAGAGLGNGSLEDSSTPVPVAAINDPNSRLTGVKALASGPSWNYTCALMDSREVACWGTNLRGRLGNITTTEVDADGDPVSTTPVLVRSLNGSGNLSGVRQVSVSTTNACALLQGGRVACWGLNSLGMLGSDETNEFEITEFNTLAFSSTPLLVKDTSGSGVLRGVREIASSGAHHCAILRNRQVACWGQNFSGGLGAPTENRTSTTPVIAHPDDPTLTRVKQVLPLANSTCVLSIQGTVDCWGSNFLGWLGNGTTTSITTPRAVKPIGGGNGRLRGVLRLRGSGVATVCAELKRNKVACWGNNRDGMLGIGTTESSSVPVVPLGVNGVGKLRNLKQIKPGVTKHTCALQKPNQVLCWGSNDRGQLGNGTNESSLVPMPIADLR